MDADKELLIRLDERYEVIDKKLDQVIERQQVQSEAHANLRVKVAGIAGSVSLVVAAGVSWFSQVVNSSPPHP